MLFAFFHSYTFISSDQVVCILCNMCLLILPISFFSRFSNLAVGKFKKFFLWSFNVMKLLPVTLIPILPMMFASLACLIPCFYLFLCVYLFCYILMSIAFCKRFAYSSLLRWYIFDVFPAAVKVLFDGCMSFKSLANLFWNLWSTFWKGFY